MKSAFLVLLLLFVVQTYGVYGRAQSDRLVVSCTLPLGPLCFAWEPNALGKVLGPVPSQEIESKLSNAKRDWEKAFDDKITKRLETRQGIDDLLADVSKRAGTALDTAGKTFGRVSESLGKEDLGKSAQELVKVLGDETKDLGQKAETAVEQVQAFVGEPTTPPDTDAGVAPPTSPEHEKLQREAERLIREGKEVSLE